MAAGLSSLHRQKSTSCIQRPESEVHASVVLGKRRRGGGFTFRTGTVRGSPRKIPPILAPIFEVRFDILHHVTPATNTRRKPQPPFGTSALRSAAAVAIAAAAAAAAASASSLCGDW